MGTQFSGGPKVVNQNTFGRPQDVHVHIVATVCAYPVTMEIILYHLSCITYSRNLL